MKKLSEYLFLGTLGGALYYGFEIIFRGFSHWTMFLLGGLCLVFYCTGKDGPLGGSSVEADSAVQYLRDKHGVYHRDYRE